MTQGTEPDASGTDLDEVFGGEMADQVGETPEPEASPTKPARDLAVIVAEALFHDAFQGSQPGKKIENTDVIIVEAPSPDWLHPVAEAAPIVLLGWQEQLPKFRRRNLPTADRPYRVFECTTSADKSRESLVNEIADKIAEGHAIIIVATDINTSIPETLRHSADHVVVLKNPRADWLDAVLTEATGDNSLAETRQAIRFEDVKPEMLKLATRRGQSAEDYARRLAKLAASARRSAQNSELKLDDLHGMPQVIEWAKLLAADLDAYKAGHLPWSDMDRGALLFGPPGTGKTTAARAIANYCCVPFFATSYSAWQGTGSGHLGDVTRAIRAVFQAARKAAPSIVFIDELDTINSRENRANHSEWWRSINNTLLEELDGASAREGVIVIGATNYPDNLDPALKRAGRLDREIEISRPDTSALEQIFRVYLGDVLPKADLMRLASLANGHTGADIALWVRGARRTARTMKRDIEFQDVLHEITGETSERDRTDLHRQLSHQTAQVEFTLLATLYQPFVMRARNLLLAMPTNLTRRQAARLSKTLHPMDRGAGRNTKPTCRSLPRHSIPMHRSRHTLTQINRIRLRHPYWPPSQPVV